jgi:hypothetical protein
MEGEEVMDFSSISLSRPQDLKEAFSFRISFLFSIW